MPYVERDGSSVVVGVFARPQRGRAEEWLPEDNPEVLAYRNPPPPTDDERIDTAFPQTDTARVIFEVFFDQENRMRTLESRSAITRAQLRTALKSLLP